MLGVKVIYRILNRESSLLLAYEQGVTDDQLCFYEDELLPDAEAILLKESGVSGGFNEKIAAAKEKDMRIIVLKRPHLSFDHTVNGPYGLRRAVEKLLPEFYPLHSGLTTGTCATAAAIAAMLQLLKEEKPNEVPVLLPNGETITEPWLSSMDEYTPGATPTMGAQVVYKLATPLTYQLSPQEVETLKGQNHVWSDAGDVDLTYVADTKLYIDNKIAQAIAAALNA